MHPPCARRARGGAIAAGKWIRRGQYYGHATMHKDGCRLPGVPVCAACVSKRAAEAGTEADA